MSLESAGWTLTREPLFAEYTAGYTTAARYDAPAGTRQDAVAAFYRRALAGWRAAGISHPVPTAARPAAPAIRCFARGVASVCVSIASFRDGRGRVTFAVLADSRAYESRPG